MTYQEAKQDLLDWLAYQPSKELSSDSVKYLCGYLSRQTKLDELMFLGIIRANGYSLVESKREVIVKSFEDIERHSEF